MTATTMAGRTVIKGAGAFGHATDDMLRAVDLKALGAQILNHALVIADGAVRSDIECYAKWANVPAEHGQGFWAYSLTETLPLRESIPEAKRGGAQFVDTLEEAAENLRIVQRAAAYIRLRGEVWAWRMVEVDGMPGYVRFVSKEQAHG